VNNATEMQDAEVFREKLEIKIPTQASTIRRDPQPALEEALRLAVP
jgi:hypothetical protein